LGAVTYPDLDVATILNEEFVPVQVNIKDVPQLVQKYRAIWTPNLNVIDGEENQIYRIEGWLPPSEYTPMLLVAKGHFMFRAKSYDGAIPWFQSVMDRFPRSAFAPEAQYYIGVSEYMQSQDVGRLAEAWKQLQIMYPESLWATKSMIM
jgi:TolA-binding protein